MNPLLTTPTKITWIEDIFEISTGPSISVDDAATVIRNAASGCV
jgi:hypothetical protein